MDIVSNDKNSILKRKYSNRLMMAGRAIIMFGLWSSLRVIILTWFGMDDTLKYFFDVAKHMVSENSVDQVLMYTIAILVVVIALGVPFLINFLLGRGAIREGQGVKKSNLYIIVCAILFILTIISFFVVETEEVYLELWIATMIVDITLCIAYVDVVYSAIRLRMYDKRRKEEVLNNAD